MTVLDLPADLPAQIAAERAARDRCIDGCSIEWHWHEDRLDALRSELLDRPISDWAPPADQIAR